MALRDAWLVLGTALVGLVPPATARASGTLPAARRLVRRDGEQPSAARDGRIETIAFGTGLVLVDAGLMTVLWADTQPCAGRLGQPGCSKLWVGAAGAIGLVVGGVVLGLDTLWRLGTRAPETDTISETTRERHAEIERLLFYGGTLLLGVGIVLDTADVVRGAACVGSACPRKDTFSLIGFVTTLGGAAALTTDAVVRVAWDVDTTGLTLRYAP